MKLRKFRYQNAEPGDIGGGGGDAAPPAPDTPAIEAPGVYAPLANNQDDPAPATPPEPAAPAGKPAEPDNASKIEALLDSIGKEPVTTPVKPVETVQEPAKPATPAVDPKALDLTPPEGMAGRAQTRWTELAERAKQVPDLERRATEAETALANMNGLAAQANLDPDEFRGLLVMGRLYKSRNQNELQEAMKHLDGLRADVAVRLGIDAPGIDPLALPDFADLAKRVDDMDLARPDALEIARLRVKAKQVEAQEAAAENLGQFKTTVQKAAGEMDAVLRQRASMPGHAAKVDHLMSYFKDKAKLDAFVETYPPNLWKAVMLTMYDNYAPPAPTVLPGLQPLRPGHVASGVRQLGSRPISAEAAVQNAWDTMGL